MHLCQRRNTTVHLLKDAVMDIQSVDMVIRNSGLRDFQISNCRYILGDKFEESVRYAQDSHLDVGTFLRFKAESRPEHHRHDPGTFQCEKARNYPQLSNDEINGLMRAGVGVGFACRIGAARRIGLSADEMAAATRATAQCVDPERSCAFYVDVLEHAFNCNIEIPRHHASDLAVRLRIGSSADIIYLPVPDYFEMKQLFRKRDNPHLSAVLWLREYFLRDEELYAAVAKRQQSK